MTQRIYKKTPKRLSQVFQQYNNPLYFVTINTWQRCRVLDNKNIQNAFVEYANMNVMRNRAIGRFVIMPDHIHFFVRGGHDFVLSSFVRLLKQHLTKVLRKHIDDEKRFWQPGFFDHLMRNDESYSDKWNYVRNNPLRAGLIHDSDDWPYQGEIASIDRV